MMVFMGVMFYKVPSGLCVYFITSSLWGIAERKLVPPAKPLGLETAAPPPSRTTSDSRSATSREKREKQAKRRK
jgi:YidC/Oxa1 family membrane protein insertase